MTVGPWWPMRAVMSPPGNDKPPTGERNVKRPIRTILALIAALAMLAACSTVGGVVDGTGKAISKGGRAVKNL